MHRRFTAFLGALALGAFTLAASSQPAFADDRSERSAAWAYHFMVYQHDDFKGGYDGFKATDRNLANNRWLDATGSPNNGISSVNNNTNYHVYMYADAAKVGSNKCTGGRYISAPNSEDRDLTNNGFDNRAGCIVFVK